MTTKLLISTLFFVLLLIEPFSFNKSINNVEQKKEVVEQDSFLLGREIKLEKLIKANKIIVKQIDQKVEVLHEEKVIYIRDTIIKEKEIIKVDTVFKETIDTIVKRKKLFGLF